MLFVQEEKYSELADNIKDKNDINISVTMNQTDLDKLMSDYDSLIDVLIENKDSVTSATIIEYIGQKKTFS